MAIPEYMPDESFWLVWNLERGTPSHKHERRDSAEREAERLANQNPGQTFFVVMAEAAFRHSSVQRQQLHERIPF